MLRYRQQLEVELQGRRTLMEQLVHAEEDTRKSLARELHDEIGQNITAIQIQSMLIKRTEKLNATHLAAGQIDQLAQRIHHSTRQLLRQLRPPVLEEMSLEKALHHLLDEFAFAQRGIDCRFKFRLSEQPGNDTVVFTLYRLMQELLNNISKHASARHIDITLTQHAHNIRLIIKDDGIGFPTPPQHGFGLQGISERIRALGGNFHIDSRNGTSVIVNLPTLLPQKPTFPGKSLS